ncbi:MAG: N-acetylmuramidase family protein, partial [Muribaculaceae bacterium]|nr:N-acetylmuramidase family protein [Muribaculaceae bacterium]
EVAAIKAVVEIEAGAGREGFWADGKPLINFDLSMYRKFAPRHGVDLAKARKRAPEVFRRPDTRRHGSYQAAQQARLDAAIAIDEESALESTFWGMFQIGGFNWKRCGAGSVREFVDRMSRSERDQLELFAAFIRNSGMVDAIRDKNWLAFALKYNGPKAKARRYHTRLAAAYRKHGGK